MIRTYRIILDGDEVGLWENDESGLGSDGTDDDFCVYMRNDGTWCANNMQDQGNLALHEGKSIPFDDHSGHGPHVCTLCFRELRLELVPLEGANDAMRNQEG